MADDQHAGHGNIPTYLAVFGVLFVITVVEVGVFYVPAFEPVLPPVLITLSTVKFALVAMFYMHLKYDKPILTMLLSGPLMIALAIGVGLMFLFGVLAI